MRIKTKRGNLPKIIFLILAMIPVCLLLFIIVLLVINSTLAINQLGLFGQGKLFSTQISGVFTSGQGQYGLIPAIWGTILIVIVSMGIAIPVSMAMAIFASEFKVGFLGQGMRTLLGILGGIPSIIYALMSIVFAQLFIIPKFTGAGLSGNQMPPSGMYWWTPGSLPYVTSTLLGGIMLSMLIIPFLAPLFDDVIQDAPNSLKEASLSLGASHWQTLTGVTIPYAMTGIISASGLGALKAMGDVVIVGMVVGFESSLPYPLFDILKSTAPLTSTGAGFSGGFSQGAFNAMRNSAANFTGLLLLVFAFGILGLVAYLQGRYKRKFPK